MRSNEKNYIKRLQSEKEDALEYIIEKYLTLIKGVVHQTLASYQNDGVIEECINDIFLSIWNNAKSFNGDSRNFKNWICTIAKFKAIDYYRKAVKKNEENLDFHILPCDTSVEEEIIRIENKDELLQLIQTLEPIDQKILFMKFFLDLKSEEIAEQLNMSKSSIDNRVFRGKKKLSKSATNFIKHGGKVHEGYL